MDDRESESPSSKSSGLTSMISRSRNKARKNRDSSSLKSAESDGQNHLRGSLDANDRPKTSIDEGSENPLKKLLPKNISSRRRQKQREKEEQELEEAARGRSVAERGTLRNDSGGDMRLVEGDGNDLIDYASDVESVNTGRPSDVRPPLSQHSSHAGYLTTSSPLVHSTTFSPNTSLEEHFDGSPRANTFPAKFDALAASESSPALLSSKLQPPADVSPRRSTSPVGRFKEALTPRRLSNNSTSPDRQSEGTSVPTEKGSEASSRRGSVATKIVSKSPERPQTGVRSPPASFSPERPVPAKVTPINTDAPPSTPPNTSGDNTPIIVNTPPTPTGKTSPNPPASPSLSIVSNPNVVTSPSGNMISHRRVRSGSAVTLGPSKLSNITSAPLTPTPENGPPPTGFFSTVFSAAQNAANTLHNSISSTSATPNRSRSGTQEAKAVESPEVETLGNKSGTEESMDEKELAVKTLGMGDLSLSHLGISEATSGSATPVASKFPDDPRGRSENEDEFPKGSNTPYMPTSDGGDAETIDDVQTIVRPRSVYDPTQAMPGEQTPNGSLFEGKSSIHRSGSIRSAMGKRRKRGSSTTTGTTIGAAIAAANASVAHPNIGSTTPKITGFAVASKKRNRDFHQLFRSVPDDDYLIEDYSCALQREILAHGRLYVSEGHLCFSSNIFGWVTTLVMSFDEIVSVEKRSTALVFKNGLMISTLHAKHIFASFTSRDSTYDLIVGIWKLGHPGLRSSLNGVAIDETGGDKTEKADGDIKEGSQGQSDSEDDSDEGDEVYDEDEEDEDGMSFTHADGSVAGSDVAERVASRHPSNAATINGVTAEKAKEDASAPAVPDFPGPVTHAATDCTDQATHYSKIIADEVIPAPLGKIYSLMFGPASLTWMRNWLTNEQKSLDLTMDDKKCLDSDNKIRTYSYIKPLNGAIGPKQTKCLSTETLDYMDLEKAVSVTVATQTPDVPSGNVFSTKTRYCLSWAEGSATRLQMNCTIEWTGKSWLKGPIEKGANDGQATYAKDIVAALRASVSSRRAITATASGKAKKKTRKGKEVKSLGKSTGGVSKTPTKDANWGLPEPVRSIFEPIADIVKPLLGGNMTYILIALLLIASWVRFGIWGRGGGGSLPGAHDLGFFGGSPARLAAYEEMWRREESELWDWLEDRVGMERLREKEMPVEKRVLGEKLRGEKMEVREVEDAIRVTEEKLKVLTGIVEGKKDVGDGRGKEELNRDNEEKSNADAESSSGVDESGAKVA